MQRMTLHQPHLKSSGFSLLEFVAVLTVIAVLGTITFGVMDGVKERQMRMRTVAELAALRGSLECYRLEFGAYPMIRSGDAAARSRLLLDALLGKAAPDGSGIADLRPFIVKQEFTLNNTQDQLVDGWGMPLYYAYDEDWRHANYFLLSAGKDLAAEFPDTNGNYDMNAEVNVDNLEGLGRE